MSDRAVAVGRMLFTLVDPHRGHEVTFNRWYERDHFHSGIMIGPGWFAGSRWVAPRRLKDLRFPVHGPVAEPVDAGSYLAVYWIHDAEQETAETWAREQAARLHVQGRSFSRRDHVHTGVYGVDSRVHRHADGVPLELALDHRYDGLAVVVVEPAPGTGRDDAIAAIDAGPARTLVDRGAVDQVSTWRATPWRDERGEPMVLGSVGGTPQRLLQLCFLTEDPQKCWDDVRAYAADVERTGVGTVSFAAPLVPTVVGTDTYTDELW